VRAGIRDVLVVTGRGKVAIADHFDRSVELEDYLSQHGKDDLLREVQAVTNLAEVHFIRQREPLGLGHAVSVAKHHVGNEPFAVMLGDDIMVDDSRLLRRMLDVQAREGGAVVALLEVKPDEISAYGSAAVEPVDGDVVRLRGVVEKPAPADAPSNLAVVGRYVLPPSIFDALAHIQPGVGGELQLTDGIARLIDDEPVHGVVFSDGRYDIGRKLDFLRANVELALERPDLGPDLEAILEDVLRRRGLR
jgi:UTP--glucose-1-phosphate uridylyltransferase